MTVSELIEKLKTFSPDLEVRKVVKVWPFDLNSIGFPVDMKDIGCVVFCSADSKSQLIKLGK